MQLRALVSSLSDSSRGGRTVEDTEAAVKEYINKAKEKAWKANFAYNKGYSDRSPGAEASAVTPQRRLGIPVRASPDNESRSGGSQRGATRRLQRLTDDDVPRQLALNGRGKWLIVAESTDK